MPKLEMMKTKITINNLIDAIKYCKATGIKGYRLFAAEILGIKQLTPYQWAAFDILVNPDRHKVILISSNSMGKTHLFAVAALTKYYLDGPGLICVHTAPTFSLVKGQLGAEIRNIYAAAKVPLGSQSDVNKLSDLVDSQWFVEGFSPKIETETDVNRFRGYHGPKQTLIIFNEGVGVHAQLFTAAEQM